VLLSDDLGQQLCLERAVPICAKPQPCLRVCRVTDGLAHSGSQRVIVQGVEVLRNLNLQLPGLQSHGSVSVQAGLALDALRSSQPTQPSYHMASQ
jgi:hypothetical protein